MSTKDKNEKDLDQWFRDMVDKLDKSIERTYQWIDECEEIIRQNREKYNKSNGEKDNA